MQRKLKPRATAALNIMPVMVSDRTCAALFGIEPRDLREKIAPHVPHAVIGRRVVMRVEHVLAYLDGLASPERAGSREPARSDGATTTDDLLARIGRRRTA